MQFVLHFSANAKPKLVIRECVSIVVQCTTFKDLAGLFELCVYGELAVIATTIQKAIQTKPEWKDVTVELVLYQKDFWKCVNSLGSELIIVDNS